MATTTPAVSARTAGGPAENKPKRHWGAMIIGIVILCVMLFPLYWMVNTALQPESGLLEVSPSRTAWTSRASATRSRSRAGTC